MSATLRRKLPDAYYDLIMQFPLTQIVDDEHLTEAFAVIDRLLQEDLDEGGQKYLDVLTDLVEAYEDEHIVWDDASESQVLRELMSQNGLTQKVLANETGISQSTISEVLNGKRSLTKEQVLVLAERFKVMPAAFLPGK